MEVMNLVIIEKYYHTYEERIKTLEDRNMTINKRSSKHRNVINDYNYYNVINGYKDLFLQNKDNETYKNGTTPDQLFALYKFDEKLRIILLEFLLPIEEKLKHSICQSFYEYFSQDINTDDYYKSRLHRDTVYQRPEFYDRSSSEKQRKYDKYIEISQSEIGIQYRKGNESIRKYRDTHQYIPMWILFNILMFGNMSKLFTILKKDIKTDVMKKMGVKWNYPDEDHIIKQFEKTLEILTLGRNRCAHNERIYTFSHRMTLSDRYLNFRNALPDPNDTINFPNRSEMKFGIFSIIFLISRFSEPKDSKRMVKMISKELKNLSKTIHVITTNDVLKLMNMNHNWDNNL
ncbi:Abi family protein [Staphylococcus equorum]|uniref:Abi family protein n=1 Tax=Staphylococcus equorum TaxID=246432 RepID=UPI00192D14DC|nr:Abi family protein [Staphylococcus equorum]